MEAADSEGGGGSNSHSGETPSRAIFTPQDLENFTKSQTYGPFDCSPSSPDLLPSPSLPSSFPQWKSQVL
jgi:hypothetical protein